MKKILAVVFAVLFAVSAFSAVASATNFVIGNQDAHCYCDYCGAAFVSAEELEEHYATMNEVAGHSVECTYCFTEWTAKSSLAKHEKACKDADHSFACKYADNGCSFVATGKGTDAKDAYKAHVKSCPYSSLLEMIKAGLIEDALKFVWNNYILVYGKQIITGIDWDGILGGLKDIGGGLIAGVDL